MDRNAKFRSFGMLRRWSLSARRAWIEIAKADLPARTAESLSARRAWIEILIIVMMNTLNGVALRKESVDRNSENPMISVNKIPSLSARRAWIEIAIANTVIFCFTSLSARRAWIEILSAVVTELLILVALRKESVDRNRLDTAQFCRVRVALRKESVDRNPSIAAAPSISARRSPQGERG